MKAHIAYLTKYGPALARDLAKIFHWSRTDMERILHESVEEGTVGCREVDGTEVFYSLGPWQKVPTIEELREVVPMQHRRVSTWDPITSPPGPASVFHWGAWV